MVLLSSLAGSVTRRRTFYFRHMPMALPLALACALLLSACDLRWSGGGREESTKLGPRVVELGQPVPKGGGQYKVGSPYRLNGQLYVPREVSTYDRRGVASWYGELFHGRRTANGEIYDMEALTAAHPTLPLPSYARITNLRNGRSLVVRVNDRGPYAGGREIDLSWAVASLLQMRAQGTAPVRVEYLGLAPLSGDDSYERQVLARQDWAGPRVAFAASPAKAIRTARAERYSHRYLRASEGGPNRQAQADFGPSQLPAAAGDRSASANTVGAAPGPAATQPTPLWTATARTEAGRRAPTRPEPGRMEMAARSGAGSKGRDEAQQLLAASAAPRRAGQAYIDTGLFRERQTAGRLASILGEIAPASVEMETINDQFFYRLIVGPFSTNRAAEAALTRIKASGLSGAYIQPASSLKR